MKANLRHLSPHGSDANPGTEAAPWRTPAHALRQLQPGDTLIFADGIYPTSEPLVLSMGTPAPAGAWTTLRAAARARPVILAEHAAGDDHDLHGEQGWLRLERSSRIRLIGLTVKNSPRGGISVHEGCTGIEILGCRIDRSSDFGIGIWNASGIRVIGNDVFEANHAQRRPDGDTSGRDRSAQEALSLGNVTDFEVAWNRVHAGGKEGIDIKRPSQRGRVHHNLVHDMARQGIYLDARRTGVMREIEVDHNISFHNGWGIGLSTEQATARMEQVHIHHNLIYANRGSGLIIAPWVQDGPRSDIVIENNTLVHNGTRLVSWAGSLGNLDLRTANLSDADIRKNLCVDGGAFDIATLFPTDRAKAELAHRRIRIAGNRAAPAASFGATRAGDFPRPWPWDGEQAIHDRPIFVAPEAGDFRLAPENPVHLLALGAFADTDADWAAEVRSRAGHLPAASAPQTVSISPSLRQS
ncbi:MAG: right-handed parallel beta-helix repeat-containing protein [Verrucomicrobia bacterium]|nr:MAG: right-handed parallel beta-helix repeat-containing protein [Verrucomicrobiota bacterium]